MSSIMFLDKRGDGVLRWQLGAKTTVRDSRDSA